MILGLITKGILSEKGKVLINLECPLNLEIDYLNNGINFSIDKPEINLETKKREINIEKVSPSIEVNIPIEEIVPEMLGGGAD